MIAVYVRLWLMQKCTPTPTVYEAKISFIYTKRNETLFVIKIFIIHENHITRVRKPSAFDYLNTR